MSQEWNASALGEKLTLVKSSWCSTSDLINLQNDSFFISPANNREGLPTPQTLYCNNYYFVE